MKQVFPMVPAPAPAVAIPVTVAILLLAGTVFFSYLAYCTRVVKFEISDYGIKIFGDLYGRTIPARDLVIDQARAIDLTADRTHSLTGRLNGTGLPGYHAGWFSMENGEKALAFVTDARRVVCIPTSHNYSVLLSVADPQQFLATLRK